MKLNKTWKVIIGLLTGWTLIYPLLFVFLWFGFMGSMFMTGDPSSLSEQEMFSIMKPFFYLMPIILISSFVQMGLLVFYLIHIIIHKEGTDTMRILLGVGLFVMPYIAMPLHYFVYILPETPPEWALIKITEVE
jgi:hypothetical protein